MLVFAQEITNVIEGHNPLVICTATGYPVPEVAWKNGGGSSLINSRQSRQSGVPLILSTGIENVSSISVELRVIGAI